MHSARHMNDSGLRSGLLLLCFLCIFHFLNGGSRIFILSVTLLGGCVEALAGLFGICRFNGSFYADWIVPLWFLALWALFASTLHYSLSWLNRRYLLAASLGAVAGPLSYFGGEKIGAIEIMDNTVVSLIWLMIIWGAGVPFLMWLGCQKPFSSGIKEGENCFRKA